MFGKAGSLIGMGAPPAPPAPPPTLTLVSPSSAGVAAGVTFTGTNFEVGASFHLEQASAFVAYFTGVSVGGPTSATGTTPNVPPGTYDIVVTNPDLQTDLLAGFIVLAAAPTVSSLRIGLVDTGTLSAEREYLYGENFIAGATVDIYDGVTLVASVVAPVVESSRCISFLPPSSLAAGTYDVRVTNPDAQNATLVGSLEAWNPELELPSGPGAYFAPGTYDGSTGTWPAAYGVTDAVQAVPAARPAEIDGFPIFDGVATWLDIADSLSDLAFGGTLATTAEGTVIVGYVPFDEPLDASYYSNAALVSGSAATPTIAHTTQGFKVAAYDGVDYQVSYGGKAQRSRHHVGFVTWSDTSDLVRAKVDGGNWTEKAMATGGLDGGGGGNVGGNTYIGANYAIGAVFKGAMTFVFMKGSVISDAVAEKFRKWSVSCGFQSFVIERSGVGMLFQPSDFSNPSGTTALWTAKVGANLIESGSPPPADSVNGPVFDGTTYLLTSGFAIGDALPDMAERHYYAKVTTTQIDTDSATAYANMGLMADSGDYTGMFLQRRGAGPYTYWALMYDFDGAEKYAEVEITDLVDANGAGSFSVQGMKKGNLLWVRANNGPWRTAEPSIGNTTVIANAFQVGKNLKGTLHEWGAWPKALPGHVSSDLAVYGGAAADNYHLLQPGLRSRLTVGDAELSHEGGGVVAVSAIFSKDDYNDAERRMVQPGTGVNGPYYGIDNTANDQPYMGTVAEGARRLISAGDLVDPTLQLSPYEVPNEGIFAFPSAQPFTVYFVCDNDLASSVVYWMINRAGSAADASNLYGTGASVTVGVQAGLAGTIGGGKRALCIVFDGATTSLYDNDASTPVATGAGGAGTAQSLAMGAYEGTPTFKIYERVEHDGAHTPEQISAELVAIGAKYNITVTP